MWAVYALLSALCASATSILAKVGIQGVGSHLATAVRTLVVLAMSWGMVFLTGQQQELSKLTHGNNLLFLILSGIATGLSWLFYYRALQMGEVSKVVPIDKLSVAFTLVMAFMFLHEVPTAKAIIGSVLITAGTLVMVL